MNVDKEVDGRAPRGGFGRALADLFRDLGYDEGELHADMFEWLFGLPSMRIQAFLDWFLTSIRPRQSVKRQIGGARDYAIYMALLRGEIGDGRDRGLLSGDELVRAELVCQSDLAMQQHGDDDSLDALEETNRRLEREIQEMEHRLRLAHERNDRLAKLMQRRTLTTDQQAQRLRRQQDKETFSEVLAHMTPANGIGRVIAVAPEGLLVRMQSTLRHLATPAHSSAVQAIVPSSSTGSYSQLSLVGTLVPSSRSSMLSIRGDGRIPRDFLYQHSLVQLEEKEEHNLRDLQSRIPAISALTSNPMIRSNDDQTQPFDVPMSPVQARKSARESDQEPQPSPWLHESDPEHLNMRSQDALLYNKCCVELERLRKAFVVGEQDSLLAQLQVTRYEAQLKQLANSRRQLLQQFQLMSRDAIWARKQILQVSLDKTKKQLGDLFQNALPQKLEELAFLKSTSILLQSYEQKLWRQENRFVKLRHLLEGFEMQQARLRLVHRLLDAERQDLLQVDAIFQHLIGVLVQHNEQTERRISSYDTTSSSDAARTTLSQTYLHEQDNVAHQLFEILEQALQRDNDQPLTNQSHRLRTFDELVRLCELKRQNDQTHIENVSLVHTEWKRLYASKRHTLRQLREELFGDLSSTTPMLLPVELATALGQASDAKDAAELGLEKALETLRLHRRSVEVDQSKRIQQERDIARLQRELQEMR